MTSLFSRIIQGEIPCYKIYEDENIFAFLDNHPLQFGHTLVIPKREVGNVLDMDDALYSHLMLVAKNIIGPAIQKATGCPRVGYVIEGFGVPDHVHVHLVPLFKRGDLDPAHAHSETPEKMSAIAQNIQQYII